MYCVPEISDFYNEKVSVVCDNGDTLSGRLILVEEGYVVIECEHKHIIIYDVRRVIIGG